MSDKKKYKDKVEEATEEVLQAVGAEWVRLFPHVETGDFDAEADLKKALEVALDRWLMWNDYLHPTNEEA